jgi:hypothetical protein
MMATTKTASTKQDDMQMLLTLASERAAKAEADAREMREQLEQAVKRLARGTSDIAAQAAKAVEAAKPQTLEQRIMNALLSVDAPMTFPVLCKATGSTPGRVSSSMSELRKARRVYNMGTEDHPRWIGVIGDSTSTPELNAWVKRLVSLAPMTFAQLIAATGARRGRVSGAIVQLQRDPQTRKLLQNLGDNRTYVWFLPTSPAVKTATR